MQTGSVRRADEGRRAGWPLGSSRASGRMELPAAERENTGRAGALGSSGPGRHPGFLWKEREGAGPGEQQVKKAAEELGRVRRGQGARCGAASRRRWRQDRDASVGEAGSWLVGTCSLPRVMDTVLGKEAAQPVSPSL